MQGNQASSVESSVETNIRPNLPQQPELPLDRARLDSSPNSNNSVNVIGNHTFGTRQQVIKQEEYSSLPISPNENDLS